MGWCSSAVPAKLEQKSIIPKVYTHIFSVSHPNGFAIDHYCGRAFLHLVLVCAAQSAVDTALLHTEAIFFCELSNHFDQS